PRDGEAERAAHPARIGPLRRREVAGREAALVLDVDRRRMAANREESAQGERRRAGPGLGSRHLPDSGQPGRILGDTREERGERARRRLRREQDAFLAGVGGKEGAARVREQRVVAASAARGDRQPRLLRTGQAERAPLLALAAFRIDEEARDAL